MKEIEKYDVRPIETEIVDYEPDTADQPPEASMTEMIVPVLRRWPVILLTFVIVAAVGVPAIWFLIKQGYAVTAAIRVSPISNPILFENGEEKIGSYETFVNAEARRISGDIVLQRVADQLQKENLPMFAETPNILQALREAVQSEKIAVGRIRDNEIIQIQMTTPYPAQGEKVVNAMLNHYLEIIDEEERTGSSDNLALLSTQKASYERRMEAQRNRIQQLVERHGASELTVQQEIALQQVASLQSELVSVNIKMISLQTQLDTLQNAPDMPVDENAKTERQNALINSDPIMNSLARDIEQYQKLVMQSEQMYAENHPELQQQRRILESFQQRQSDRREELLEQFNKNYASQRDAEQKRSIAQIQNELTQMQKFHEKLNEKLNSYNEEQKDLGITQWEIDSEKEQLALTKELYDQVTRRMEEIEVERKRPARISKFSAAVAAPLDNKKMKMMGALGFGGLGLGFALAFLLAKADKSVHHPDDVARRVGVRIIGTTTSPRDIDQRLLPQQISDDYQTIRANLGLLNGDGSTRVLVVTSAGMGDGKTTFAVNLATSFAQAGKKTLLIDGDLRKPDVGVTLNLPQNLRGLQDVLFGKPLEQSVYRVRSSGLYILAADDRNASDALDLISRPQTGEVIRRSSEQYDHVIIDTPPVLAFSDALLWARIADAVVLTSFVGHTAQPDLREATERLEQIGARVLGTVVNNVRVSHGYHRYGYGYGYGYQRTDDAKRRSRRPRSEALLLASNASQEPSES